MGVYCLSSYLRQVGALKRVDLIQEIKQYRSETNLVPVIVIDGMNFILAIVRVKNLPWLTGGNIREFEKYIRMFIRKLRENFVEVVVFFDGVHWSYNTETWIKRRKENIKNNYKRIFDKLDENATVDVKKSKSLPGSWPIANMVLIEEGCQVIKAVCDCDFEIAAYVKQHKCLGIIADDSDFIINCSCNIYTSSEVDIDNMTIMKRDRNKLLNSLLIEPKMLPLFASLVGNDVVNFKETSHIRSHFWRKNRIDLDGLFRFLASYVMNLNTEDNISDDILTQVAQDILNNAKKADLLKRSLDSYDATPDKIEAIVKEILAAEEKSNWATILKMVFNYQRKAGGCSYIFSIVAQNIFGTVESLEDFRKKDIPPIMKILKPLRKKIYGVLLHEKPGEHIVMEMVVDNDKLFEPCLVEAIPPKVAHPGLVALWGRVNEETNWALLGDVMGIEPSKIKNLPYHLYVPALAFRYLKENDAIEKWEILSAVLSTVIVSCMSDNSLCGISLRRVQSRAVRIHALICRTYDHIRILIESLGNMIPLNETVPTLYHDGNIFHLVYNTMKEGIKPSSILKLGYENCFKQGTLEACEGTFEEITSFVFEDSVITIE